MANELETFERLCAWLGVGYWPLPWRLRREAGKGGGEAMLELLPKANVDEAVE